jgi:hypothetical protein
MYRLPLYGHVAAIPIHAKNRHIQLERSIRHVGNGF